MEELCSLYNYQHYCTMPKKMKCGRVRRPKLTFSKRIIHRKSVDFQKVVTPVRSSLFQYFDGWDYEDDNDPVSLPYRKYLHLSVLPVW